MDVAPPPPVVGVDRKRRRPARCPASSAARKAPAGVDDRAGRDAGVTRAGRGPDRTTPSVVMPTNGSATARRRTSTRSSRSGGRAGGRRRADSGGERRSSSGPPRVPRSWRQRVLVGVQDPSRPLAEVAAGRAEDVDELVAHVVRGSGRCGSVGGGMIVSAGLRAVLVLVVAPVRHVHGPRGADVVDVVALELE